MGERRDVHRVLVENLEGKRQLGRPRHRWEDNIKMNLHEARCGSKYWFKLAQDGERWQALVNVVKKPSGSIKCWNFLDLVENWLALKKDPAPWSK
jgi:uncharacterized Fe-S cluster-containing protein